MLFILSKKGGLPETINNPIFLENVSTKSIYEEIDKLINNRKLLNKIQFDSFSKPLHLIKDNIKIIDNDRKNILENKKTFFVNKKSKLKILHIYNKQFLPNYGVFDEKRYFQKEIKII